MDRINEINELLERSRTIAVVGCSPKPDRDSYRVSAYLQAAGYRVIPVNPVADEILGEVVYPDLASIPPEIEIDIVQRDVLLGRRHQPTGQSTVEQRTLDGVRTGAAATPSVDLVDAREPDGPLHTASTRVSR